ncbi:MAG TPA: hypothetical protein VE396_10685 [Xanthobacteraceae bacterium]|nr:hypothetical protein [Xanthobacteraceae bacterium]
MRIVQRLYFTLVVGGQVGFESQVVKPGAAFDEVELAAIEVIGIAEYRVKLAEGGFHGLVPLGRLPRVVTLRCSDTSRGAGDHRQGENQEQDWSDARDIPARRQNSSLPA